jgi:carbamoyl-phosphate synthase large subunit
VNGNGQTFTVLLSSAGRRVSLLRSLREAVTATGLPARIIACDVTWLAPAMHTADAGFVVPACTHPDFAASVTELCHNEDVNLVIPTIDTELMVWAQLKPAMAETGTTVAVSDPRTIEIAADKRKTNRHCTALGVPCPRQASLAEVRANRAAWRLPLVVKPARGSSSNGVRHVSTWEEFDQILDGCNDLIVEERAMGAEHTVDIYVDPNGNPHCPVVRRRLEVRSGEVSKAQVVEDSRLASLAIKTVEKLPGAYGPLNVQMFSDGHTASVVEINARFGGGYPLTWRAGGRYGEWLAREACGQSPSKETEIDTNLTMLRWDEEVFVDAH